MNEIYVHADTLPEAYHEALYRLGARGAVVDCPDWETRCLEAGLTMVVEHPMQEPMISRLMPATPYDLQKYKMELLDGILDFCIGHGWSYTYHERMRSRYMRRHKPSINQLDFVVEELRDNPNSRRAIIDIRNNLEDIDSSDPACLQHIQFLLRDGKLDMDVLFRSNDAVNAAFMNDFGLIMLQERIAGELGVPVGSYVKRVNSFHAYERDWPKLGAWRERILWDLLDTDELTYEYEGDWKDLMAEEEANVKRFADKLRRSMKGII